MANLKGKKVRAPQDLLDKLETIEVTYRMMNQLSDIQWTGTRMFGELFDMLEYTFGNGKDFPIYELRVYFEQRKNEYIQIALYRIDDPTEDYKLLAESEDYEIVLKILTKRV